MSGNALPVAPGELRRILDPQSPLMGRIDHVHATKRLLSQPAQVLALVLVEEQHAAPGGEQLVSCHQAGQAATGSLTVATGASAPGTLNLYIGGQRVQVAINAGEAPAITASDIAEAINAMTSLDVTAVSAAAVVRVIPPAMVAVSIDLPLPGSSGHQCEQTPISKPAPAIAGISSQDRVSAA